jgi:hypothetical protein
MGVGSQRHAPAALPRRKSRYPLYTSLGGPQGHSGRVRKISPPTGIRSQDRPARSESLYRLSYPGPPLYKWTIFTCICYQSAGLTFGSSDKRIVRNVLIQNRENHWHRFQNYRDCNSQYKLKFCVIFKTFLPRRLKKTAICAEWLFTPALVVIFPSEFP